MIIFGIHYLHERREHLISHSILQLKILESFLQAESRAGITNENLTLESVYFRQEAGYLGGEINSNNKFNYSEL